MYHDNIAASTILVFFSVQKSFLKLEHSDHSKFSELTKSPSVLRRNFQALQVPVNIVILFKVSYYEVPWRFVKTCFTVYARNPILFKLNSLKQSNLLLD